MKSIAELKKSYKRYKGFYDLRKFALNRQEFLRYWDLQDNLFHMQERAEYFKKWHPAQWQQGQELSAQMLLVLMKRGDI